MRFHRRQVYLVAACVMGLTLLLGCGAADPTAPVTGSEGMISPVYTPTLFPVREDGKWGFIDKTGRVVIDFQWDKALGFSDGMAPVEVGENWGYIDESGALVIHPQWYRAGSFSDGLAPVYVHNNAVVTEVAALVTYIDKTGKTVIPSDGSSDGGEFSEGLADIYLLEGGCEYIDSTGQVAFQLPEATAVRHFSQGLAAVRDGDLRWGYIDRTGRFVIEPRFRDAQEFSNGLAVVEYGYHEYEIIDKTGQVVRKLEYDHVYGLKEGRAAVLIGGPFANMDGGRDMLTAEGWGYMDESGALVIPTQFDKAWDFAGGLARVTDKNGKMGYIDLSGKYVWREK